MEGFIAILILAMIISFAIGVILFVVATLGSGRDDFRTSAGLFVITLVLYALTTGVMGIGANEMAEVAFYGSVPAVLGIISALLYIGSRPSS